MRRIKIIYYAHYHKLGDVEKIEDKKKIHKWCSNCSYDYLIIDPSDVCLKKVSGLRKGAWMGKFEMDMEEVFFPLIDMSDIVIFSNKEEEKAVGVRKELEHGYVKGKTVISVDSLETICKIENLERS